MNHKTDTNKENINRSGYRMIMLLLTILLFTIEIIIGMYASGWIRAYFGDVLVVILIYTLIRTVSPDKPKYGIVLPLCILIFSFIVEFLQLWGIADRLHITNKLMRIIIGTGFSTIDLLCYAAGILPCFVIEFIMKRRSSI